MIPAIYEVLSCSQGAAGHRLPHSEIEGYKSIAFPSHFQENLYSPIQV